MIVKNIGADGGTFGFKCSKMGNCDGFTFEPSGTSASWLTASTSDTAITITVASCDEPSNRIGYIVAKHNGSVCTKKTIEVNQKGARCQCYSLSIDWKNSRVEADFTGPILLGEITSKDSCINWEATTTATSWIGLSTSGNYINATIKNQNTSTTARTAEIVVSSSASTTSCAPRTFKLTQAASSVTCNCQITTITTNPTWASTEYGEHNKKLVFTYPTDSACGTVTPTVAITDDFASGKTEGEIYVYPKSGNTSTIYNKTGTVTLSITCSNGSDSKTVNLKQEAARASCECEIITESLTWSHDDTSEKEIIVRQSDCTTGGSITFEGESHFTASSWDDGIKIKPKETNSGSNLPIIETAKVNISCTNGSTSEANVTVTHNGTACTDNCDSIIDFKPTKEKLEASGATEWTQIGTYDYDSTCDDKVGVNSSKDWLSVSGSNKEIYAKWDAYTSTETARSATITAMWNGSSCSGKTFTVEQEKYVCPSYNITANPPSPSTGGTVDFKAEKQT